MFTMRKLRRRFVGRKVKIITTQVSYNNTLFDQYELAPDETLLGEARAVTKRCGVLLPGQVRTADYCPDRYTLFVERRDDGFYVSGVENG